jgi:hypothetical protein
MAQGKNAAVSWLDVMSEPAPLLQSTLEKRVAARLESKQFRADEIEYVRGANFSPIQGTLNVSEPELNILRRMCQAWEVELRAGKISSHRPIIGPVIVRIKRMLFPLVHVFLKDFVKQQKDFNSSALALMGTLLSERDKNSQK